MMVYHAEPVYSPAAASVVAQRLMQPSSDKSILRAFTMRLNWVPSAGSVAYLTDLAAAHGFLLHIGEDIYYHKERVYQYSHVWFSNERPPL